MSVEEVEAPLFSDYNKGRLFRMAVAALRTIEIQAADHLEKMQRAGEKKAEHALREANAKAAK